MKLRPTAVCLTVTWPAAGEPTETSSQVKTSGPPVRLKRMARTLCMAAMAPELGQMLSEECGGALVGLLGGSGIPGLAADAREGMIDAGINVDGAAADTP